MGQELDAHKGADGSWLQDRLAALNAIYRRFGREGLKEQPIADVTLLLSAKELVLRDAPKGRELTDEQKAANRQLELEIKDLAGLVNAHLAGANLSGRRAFQAFGSWSEAGKEPLKGKDRGRTFDLEK